MDLDLTLIVQLINLSTTKSLLGLPPHQVIPSRLKEIPNENVSRY